ncbi:hypothetical protein RRG08_042578 [Elysia crispata]|uniref:Uncharacterized protein n=1 Tax=Elysia crispata TaxID=231223 RepID=A0AAE0XQQ0_9GAST|nr:hypothetical protein RRG08_042578 [Elysia crispata]
MSSPLPRPIDSQCRFIENRRYEDMSMASGATTGRAVHGASRAGTSDTVGVHGRFLVKMNITKESPTRNLVARARLRYSCSCQSGMLPRMKIDLTQSGRPIVNWSQA